MIVVDTNVISEALRAQPDPRVRDWLNRQSRLTLYVSTVTVAEMMLGVEILPDGRRRTELREMVATALAGVFEDRILPFDLDAANAYGSLVSGARTPGISISVADGQIAAIAASRGFAVATRDVAAFDATQVEVINPWQ